MKLSAALTAWWTTQISLNQNAEMALVATGPTGTNVMDLVLALKG